MYLRSVVPVSFICVVFVSNFYCVTKWINQSIEYIYADQFRVRSITSRACNATCVDSSGLSRIVASRTVAEQVLTR